uniref:Uncharacterized protein n=1 Tax=Cucumis melo TaxID=3656 RepID=A0A9I9DS79_CUCME
MEEGARRSTRRLKTTDGDDAPERNKKWKTKAWGEEGIGYVDESKRGGRRRRKMAREGREI